MDDLLSKLEIAALHRSPALATLLQPSLTEKQIRSNLKRLEIEGALEPIFSLYTWHNGTRLAGSSLEDSRQAALIPPRMIPLGESDKAFFAAAGVKLDTSPEHYHFLDLKAALSIMKSIRSQSLRHPELAHLAGRYVPFLSESYFGGMIAVDIDPTSGNRVAKLQLRPNRDTHPLRLAYDSFDQFLADAMRCNETDQPLTCLISECQPIAPTPVAATATTQIPSTDNLLVLRTDFSNDAGWKSLCAVLQNPDDEFAPDLDLISNPAFANLDPERISAIADSSHLFAFMVDQIAITQPEHPILVVDLRHKPIRTFRVIASAFALVANNLDTANMGFDEFLKDTDAQGIFRGMRQH